MKIKKITGREILDSRGFPTIECQLELEDGSFVSASVPSGASVGVHEAHELRDNDPKRYLGKGVLRAIKNLEDQIGPIITGKKPDLLVLDQEILQLDGTGDKSKLGANAILAASIAIARAQAHVENLELFALINTMFAMGPTALPSCMFNIINGGVHADNGVSFQEFMIIPKAQNSAQQVHACVLIYQSLKKVLNAHGLHAGVGDEGGVAPVVHNSHETSDRMMLNFLMQAVHDAGFFPDQISFALDVAASQFYQSDGQRYALNGQQLSSQELVGYYAELIKDYPIASIEDGMAQDDWSGWKLLTEQCGGSVQLVGDDLFVTNTIRINQGITRGVANAVLIKPNQIGTISETVQAIKLCKQAGYKTIVSHRSGETNDSFIVDLAVGAAAGQLKAGACVRGERVAKYNRLLEIERKLYEK
jgi:enolase